MSNISHHEAHMFVINKFKLYKRIVSDLLIIVGVFFLFYRFTIKKIIVMPGHYGFMELFEYLIIPSFLAIAFFCMMYFMIRSVRRHIKLGNIIIKFNDGRMKIICFGYEYEFEIAELIFVYKHVRGILLVIDYDGLSTTFEIPKSFYDNKAFNKIDEILQTSECYTKNEKIYLEKRKEMKLDNIFRKNRLEYYILKSV